MPHSGSAGTRARAGRSGGFDPLVLVAHGSRDPRAAQTTWALARAVGAACPQVRVETAFLDFERPGLAAALTREAERGQRAATVVPLLLTAAYHGRVDVPGEIEKVGGRGLAIGLAPVLGPMGGAGSDGVAVDLLVRALRRRLDEVCTGSVDGLVLAAAGTSYVTALGTVDLVAAALGDALAVPCIAGYASGAGQPTGAAVRALRAGGARHIAVAGYFLAPGLLYDRAVADALAAGARVAAAPMGAAAEIAQLVLQRANSTASAA
jgi:sirohydrochlorin ferrochelatase